MGDLHAFGASGRAGGEEGVGEAVLQTVQWSVGRPEGRLGCRVRLSGDHLPFLVQIQENAVEAAGDGRPRPVGPRLDVTPLDGPRLDETRVIRTRVI